MTTSAIPRAPENQTLVLDEQLRAVDAMMRTAALGGPTVLGVADETGTSILGAIAADALSVPGKRLRARLALEGSAALSSPASPVDARPWAAAVELVHNASLVHDDLQDGDRMRRGRPSTWAVYGAAQAINAGDLLLTVPYRLIGRCDVGGEVRWLLVDALARAVEQMARGQADEPGLRAGLGASEAATKDKQAAWLACARMKTGALLGVPVEGAALLAGLSASQAHSLARPFARAGELFQLVDDVIDAFGDKGRDCRGCDLDEGKVSSLVLAHLARHPKDAPWLLAVLDAPRGQTSARDIDEAIARFDGGGALNDVLDHIARLADSVRSAPMLASEPRLACVAADLVSRVLAPLQQLARTQLTWDQAALGRRVS